MTQFCSRDIWETCENKWKTAANVAAEFKTDGKCYFS